MILAIDTAARKIGLCVLNDDNSIYLTKQLNYEKHSDFDEIEFLKWIKQELAFLATLNIKTVIMEKQFITTYTHEDAILILRKAHQRIKEVVEFMFETKVIETEAQPWKYCCVKELKLSDFVDYKDKQAWVKLFLKLNPAISEITEDEADAYFIARFANYFTQKIQELKHSITIRNNNYTLIFSYDARRNCIWEINKNDNNLIQTKTLNTFDFENKQ